MVSSHYNVKWSHLSNNLFLLCILGKLVEEDGESFAWDGANSGSWLIISRTIVYVKTLYYDFLATRGVYGDKIIFSYSLEAYFWLQQSTTSNAKAMSWWAYQLIAMELKNVKLDYLDDVFTTSHWMVRIYKDKPPDLYQIDW